MLEPQETTPTNIVKIIPHENRANCEAPWGFVVVPEHGDRYSN